MKQLKFIFVLLGLSLIHQVAPYNFDDPEYFYLYPLSDIKNSIRGYIHIIADKFILLSVCVYLYSEVAPKYREYIIVCCMMVIGIIIEYVLNYNEPWIFGLFGVSHIFLTFIGVMIGYLIWEQSK